jgi:hypothetical protein
MLGAFAALIAATASTTAVLRPDQNRAYFKPARTIVARVSQALPPGGSVRLDAPPSLVAYNVEAALVYELRRQGMKVTAPNLAVELGGSYRGQDPSQQVVRVHDGNPLVPGERLMGRFAVSGLGLTQPKVITVGLVSGVTTLNRGVWSWFQDPRAVHYHGIHDKTYVGAVGRRGDILVTEYDHTSGAVRTKVLHSGLQG